MTPLKYFQFFIRIVYNRQERLNVNLLKLLKREYCKRKRVKHKTMRTKKIKKQSEYKDYLLASKQTENYCIMEGWDIPIWTR